MDTKQFEQLPINEMKALFLFLGKALVESTDTKLDDKFYNLIAKMIEEDKSIVDLLFDIF